MPSSLSEATCITSYKGARKLDPAECNTLLEWLDDWELADFEGVIKLSKRVALPHYEKGATIIDRIVKISSEQQHHPEIIYNYGFLHISWWTHYLQGLHRNDFIMAAKTDAILQSVNLN